MIRLFKTLPYLSCGVVFSLSLSVASATGSQSDFDIFLQRLGGKIPFPPQEIITQLLRPNDHPIISEVIPHGRSLERDSTDYEFPRSVVAWNPNGEKGPSVFLGYTPKKKQLEIISYNRNTGKNEFRVITNYEAGKTPQISEPPRGACTACHQGGYLIFSGTPWEETTVREVGGDVLAGKPSPLEIRLRQAVKDPFAKFLLTAPIMNPSETPGVLIRDAKAFEAGVKEQNHKSFAISSCNGLCGSDLECRRKVLSAFVFSRRSDYAKYLDKNDLKSNSILPEINPKFQFINVESILDSRDPIKQESIIDGGALKDPLAPRERWIQSPTLETISSYCMFSTPGDRMDLSQYTYTELLDLLNSSEITELIKGDWFPAWSNIDKALKRARSNGSPKKQILGCTQGSQTTPMGHGDQATLTQLVNGIPPSPNDTLSAPQLTIRYCASCHYGQGSIAPTLPLDDFLKLKNYKGTAGRTVETLLKNKIMPPNDADQPNETEREVLIKAMQDASEGRK